MTFQFHNRALHFKDEGQGPALILLHGYPESLAIWDDYAHELSKWFRIIRPDLPGLGNSAQIAEVHTMELMAEAVQALLHHLGVKKCVMIGHSMGGYVTLAFVEQYPEMVNGFGLFHSMAQDDTREGKINRDRTSEMIAKNRSGFLNQFIPNLFAPENQTKYLTQIHALQKIGSKASPEALIACMQGMKLRKKRLHVLENSRVPVLFILGFHDSKMPYDKVLAQTVLPAVCHTLTLKNAAHMGFIEERDVTMITVKSFTAGCYQLSEANHSA